MKKKISLSQKTIFCVFLLLLFSGCNTQNYAPRRIGGYTFEVTTKTTKKKDSKSLNKPSYYTFREDGTYTLSLEGEVASAGDYSYKIRGKNKAQIIFTYDTANAELNYSLDLVFVGHLMGTWENAYDTDPSAYNDAGTFTIIKRER